MAETTVSIMLKPQQLNTDKHYPNSNQSRLEKNPTKIRVLSSPNDKHLFKLTNLTFDYINPDPREEI